MKIIAYDVIEHENVYEQKRCTTFGKEYFAITLDVGGLLQTIVYSKHDSIGLSLQQAQDMLKVLGIELIEEKEINTFEEFGQWLRENRIVYNGDHTYCIGVPKESKVQTITKAEEQYNVKLNILK